MVNCQLCKTSTHVTPYRVVHGVQLYRCVKCGLAFVDPRTTRQQVDYIYAFADYKAREAQFRQRYQAVIALIGRHIKGTNILEVGAGFGLLSSMLSSAYQVTALEPAVKPQYLKGTSVQVVKKTLAKFAASTKSTYDCIILFDVLEHVDTLEETIAQLKQLLAPSGIVVIQTPNYQSLMQRVSKDWSWWMVEDHRFFFSKQSLIRLFDVHGFTTQHYTTYEDTEDFKKNLDGWGLPRWQKLVLYPFLLVLRYFQPRGLHLAVFRYNRA